MDHQTETDFDAIVRIFRACAGMKGKWRITREDGEADITIEDFGKSVVLVFDKEGRLIG